jgi:hypothetical protein
MAFDNDDKDRKHSRRRQKTNNFPGTICPKSIVLSPMDAATQPGAIEVGVVLVVAVLLLFFFGFYESVISLPNVPGAPDFPAHMGENLNLAINAFDSFKNKNVARKTLDGEAPSDTVVIPPSRWPVSLRDEQARGLYETITHTGDLTTQLQVPRFWSPPIHKGRLMSRETAMKIGSCAQPDVHGTHARGAACPLRHRTIYIGIASYRDFECRGTVEEAFRMAKYPERIRVGVVDQIVLGEDPVCNAPHQPCDKHPEQALCKYKDQVDVYQMDANLSIGPVFARHIGYRLYRGEYYATQSDAHVSFTQDWDVDIVSQIESTHNEMAVLTTYLTDVQGSIDKQGRSTRKTRPIMCNTVWEGGAQGMHLRHASQPEKFPSIPGEPQLSPWWAAGYSFSRGHFVVNVPYDPYQPMIFQGEEMSIGYDRSVCSVCWFVFSISLGFTNYLHACLFALQHSGVYNRIRLLRPCS